MAVLAHKRACLGNDASQNIGGDGINLHGKGTRVAVEVTVGGEIPTAVSHIGQRWQALP